MPDKFYTSQDKWLTFQIYLENPPKLIHSHGLTYAHYHLKGIQQRQLYK